MHRWRSAFTLIELLVVIGIIAILLAILMPSLGKVREIGRTTGCAANMRSIGQACAAYTTSNDGTIIPYRIRVLPATTPPYVYFPHILTEGKYITAPTLPLGQAGPAPLASGPFFCPSGNMDLFPPNLVGNTSVPSSRTDDRGASPFRYDSPRSQSIIDCWYGMNATEEPSPVRGLPGRAIDGSTGTYTKIPMIRNPSSMVLFFDGLVYHYTVYNASRINARHGKKTQTNILFVDGHVETWLTKDLPGGLNPTVNDVTLANISANYKHQPLKWYLEQP